MNKKTTHQIKMFMNNVTPLLSIMMISSGRFDTLKKSLDSLNSLRASIPSELIIINTDPSQRLGHIIREYTDIVKDFNWVNDFSAARNIGLEAAKGEWFLYLDDDEWFIDTKAIEEFFLSGEYKGYNYANYYQRNYENYSETLYKDASVTRCFKITGGIRFRSKIHEYPYPLTGRGKNLKSYVKHFGYITTDLDQAVKRKKRNISLLQQMIEEEPGEIRWYKHLVQEYRSEKYCHRQIRFCRDSLAYFLNNQKCLETDLNSGPHTSPQSSPHTGPQLDPLTNLQSNLQSAPQSQAEICCILYSALIEGYLIDYEYSAALETVKLSLEGIADFLPRASILYFGANAAFFLQEYELCKAYAGEYLEIFDTHKNDEDINTYRGLFIIEEAFEERNIACIYGFLYSICLYEENPEKLDHYFEYIKSYKDIFMDTRIIDDILKYMEDKADSNIRSLLTLQLNTLLENDKIDDHFAELIKRKTDADPSYIKRSDTILSDIASKNPFINSLKLRYFILFNEEGLSILFRELPLNDYIIAAQKLFTTWDEALISKVMDIIEAGLGDDCKIRTDYLKVMLQECMIIQNTRWAALNSDKAMYTLEDICLDIKAYIDLVAQYFSSFYKPEAFILFPDIMMDQARLSAKLTVIYGAIGSNDIIAALRYIKDSINIYNPMAPVLKYLSQLIVDTNRYANTEEV